MDPAQFIDPSLGVPAGTPATSLPGSVSSPQQITSDVQVPVDPSATINMNAPLAAPMEQSMIATQHSAPSSSMVTTPTTPLPHVPHIPYSPLSTASQLIQKRRSSTRSIKRKKFDDEVVESSLQIKAAERTPRIKELGKFDISPLVGVASPTPEDLPVQPTVTPTPVTPVVQPPPEKKQRERKPSKSRSKKTSKSTRSVATALPPVAVSTKDLGRWKPQDDLILITNVQQTNDLTAVHLGVKFSCKFTLREVQERWYALLYDPVLSKLAVQAIKQLHPDIVASIQSKTLFSKDEETLLGKVSSTSQPTLEVFEDMLQKNSDTFYPARTSKALYSHWLLMKQYHLLPDQSGSINFTVKRIDLLENITLAHSYKVQPMPRGDHVLNFSDAEDIINDEDLREPRDEALEHELTVADRRQKREIRHLEQELPKWQVLVDSITGISPPDFDNQTLAVLRGRLVRYLMRSREITLGRATKDNPIDVDLSLEGPAWKISRRQGVIKLRNNGDFFVANEGRRPIYIDGKPVLNGNKQKLNNNSVVEISCLRFIFLINQDLINVIRAEAQKLNP